MGVGKFDREGRQENKNPTPPIPWFLPSSLAQTWGTEKGYVGGGKGTLRQQTS
jgi:hypothetical protein